MRMEVAVSSRATARVMTTPLVKSHVAFSEKAVRASLSLPLSSMGILPR